MGFFAKVGNTKVYSTKKGIKVSAGNSKSKKGKKK